MPLKVPQLDDRTYQDLLNETLARIPIHTPEWTNFNRSDPGVTLIELFSFLSESLLYRCNQIPERNHRKFLSLLNVPLQPAIPAQGLVTFTNDRGPLQTITLNSDLEVRAGQVPFCTQSGVDVLPIETRIYYKRKAADPSGQALSQYNQLYAFQNNGYAPPTQPLFYETVPFTSKTTTNGGIDLSRDTVDNSLWIALLVRSVDAPYSTKIDTVRQAIAGKTVSLGVVPVLSNATRALLPINQAEHTSRLHYAIPRIPPGGRLPDDFRLRTPQYLPLDAREPKNVLAEPGRVEITLPANVQQLTLWSNLDPFETGTGDFPPALEDTTLGARLITWLRVSASPTTPVRLAWLGINTVSLLQQAYMVNELLPDGTGEPDQIISLSRTPIVSNSVHLTVTTRNQPEIWHEIDDLLSATSEASDASPWTTFGTSMSSSIAAKVFSVDAEAGEVHFGDGIHGARPPYQAKLRADYAYSVGPAGNVEAGLINSSPALPPGFQVTNPIRTWGGAPSETVADAEKRITQYLRHQDRLLTSADFAAISKQTPGVNIGRVEVLPAYNPALPTANAPGAVTLMLIPKNDPNSPDAPHPDRLFLDTIGNYLEPRRLITTQLFLRGPVYKSIWVSLGITVVPGASIPQVREAVKAAIVQFLSPLPTTSVDSIANLTMQASSQSKQALKGWPLHKPVVALELLAVASRVDGVMLINAVLLAEGSNPNVHQVPMSGLELPHLAGMVVSNGDPLTLEQVRGQSDLSYANISTTGKNQAINGQNGTGGPDNSSGPGGLNGPGNNSGPNGSGARGNNGGSNGPSGPGTPARSGAPQRRQPNNPFVPLPITPEECR